MRTLLGIFVIVQLALVPPARADWIRVLPGPTARVAAAGGHVAVLRGHAVWLLRDDGSVVARLGRQDGKQAPPHQRGPGREAQEILDTLGVADADRDTDWAVDLVDDERTLAQRRAARPSPAPAPRAPAPAPVLAAGAQDIWIASAAGVLRFGPDGAMVRERGPQACGRTMAAAGPRLLVARPDGLVLMSAGKREEHFLTLSMPAEKVALSADGERWAYATPAGLAWGKTGSEPQSIGLDGKVADLAYCGDTLVALLADSMLAIPADGGPEVRTPHMRACHFLCPQDKAMPWLAVGSSLLVSFDEGRHWQNVETPAGLTLVDVALTRQHVWLATGTGLYCSAPKDTALATEPPGPGKVAARRRRRGAAGWFSWLPKVSLRASSVFGSSGRTIEALAFAQFPLAARRLPIVQAALEETARPTLEAAPARHSEHGLHLHDPDHACLIVARRKAVELAMTEPQRAASYVTRAGRAAWLPELRVLVARRYGRSESLDLYSSATALSSPLGIDTVNDIRYEARATWDLAKLVFSTEELAAQNQALHMAELRRDIESTVNRLYFERRRLALDAASADSGTRHLRMTEIETELDSLSAGAFVACTRDRSP